MNRVVTLIYGAGSYAIFFLTFLYAIGFLGNVLVPKSLDSGPVGPLGTALLIDMGLLTLFAIQHSVMARPAFKQLLTRVVSPAAERSTYVLASSLALVALFGLWRPLGGVVWEVQHTVGRALLYGGFAAGWALVLVTTFVINHFDLFGLRQAWRHFRGRQQEPLRFVTPFLYRVVRHPLYVGWLLAFWSTPTMTVTHLLFAAVTTVYILVAIQLEERDLMDAHPDTPPIAPGSPCCFRRGGSDACRPTSRAWRERSGGRHDWHIDSSNVVQLRARDRGLGCRGSRDRWPVHPGPPDDGVHPHRVLLFLEELAPLRAVARGTPLAGGIARTGTSLRAACPGRRSARPWPQCGRRFWHRRPCCSTCTPSRRFARSRLARQAR